MELPEQVGRYTESRAAGLQDWHPTRPEMLITTRFGDTNQIHRVTQPGGARTQLTFFPDRVDGGIVRADQRRLLHFFKGRRRQRVQSELPLQFLADGEITLLTDGKSRNSEPVWSNRGDRIAYTSTRRNGADTDIYIESPADPKSDRLLAELKGGGWEPADWSPDDKQLLVLEEISINESYLWLFDTQTGEKKAITTASSGRGRKGRLLGGARFRRTAKAFSSRPTGSPNSSDSPTSISPAASIPISCRT